MAPIKTCVLGTGLSGLTFHIPFILALPDLFNLYAVLERSPSAPGGRVSSRFPEIPPTQFKIYTSLDAVLADPEIELVIIGTPSSTHFEYAKRCLEANKHALVEKPVCTSTEEARILDRIAQERKLVLYAFQNRRWDSDFLALKRLLGQSEESKTSLGDIVELETQCVSLLITFNDH